MSVTDDHNIRSVCVYCASSQKSPAVYLEAAERLGGVLAREGIGVVYGGSCLGTMGRLAEAALAEGGKVTGVMPRFMADLEWSHSSLTELHVVDTIHERKRLMLELSDAVVALPGGCGTLEELMEAITWKRLGLYFGPVLLVNVKGFFDPLIQLLENSIREGFMSEKHGAMWSVVADPEAVPEALRSAPPWGSDARDFAAIR